MFSYIPSGVLRELVRIFPLQCFIETRAKVKLFIEGFAFTKLSWFYVGKIEAIYSVWGLVNPDGNISMCHINMGCAKPARGSYASPQAPSLGNVVCVPQSSIFYRWGLDCISYDASLSFHWWSTMMHDGIPTTALSHGRWELVYPHFNTSPFDCAANPNFLDICTLRQGLL